MKLPGRRRRSTKAKALDAVASLTKTWMDSKVAQGAGQTVAKGARKVSSVKGAVGSTRLKALGALALAGGAAAAVARKLKGGGEPDPFTTYEPADPAAATNGGAAPPVAAAPEPEPEPEPEPAVEPEPEAAVEPTLEPEPEPALEPEPERPDDDASSGGLRKI